MTNASPWYIDCVCPICGGETQLLATLPWPQFGHIDFSPFAPGPSEIFGCIVCGAGGNSSPNGIVESTKIFNTDEYALRSLPVHYVWPTGSVKGVPAPDHQVGLLADGLSERAVILDIGCFDGRLLRAFQRRLPNAELVGYDVTSRLKNFFSDEDGIDFVCSGLDDINGKFDLITMSHSLQYVADIPKLLNQISKLLAPGGRLFIQVPDVAEKPSDLLLADCHHHFTIQGLTCGLSLNGFRAMPMNNNAFSRDILIIAQYNGEHNLLPCNLDCFKISIEELITISAKISSIMYDGPWYVLGTTVSASFVGYLLGKSIIGYLDEAPNIKGMLFQDLPVFNPAELKLGSKTLLPLGPSGEAIKRRFEEMYQGEFILI